MINVSHNWVAQNHFFRLGLISPFMHKVEHKKFMSKSDFNFVLCSGHQIINNHNLKIMCILLLHLALNRKMVSKDKKMAPINHTKLIVLGPRANQIHFIFINGGTNIILIRE